MRTDAEPTPVASLVLAACAALAVAWAIAQPLAEGTYAGLLLPGAVGLAILVAVATAAPVALLGLGFCLLAIVPTDPAPVDVVLGVLILVTALSRRVRPAVPATVGIPLLLFAAVTVLSTVTADSWSRALVFEATTIYLVVLAAWLTWVLRGRRALRVAVQAYLVAAAVSGVAAALALYVGFPGSDTLLYDPFRAQGLFKDPNVFGPFLVPAAAILLEEIGRPRLLRWPRFLVLAAFLSCTIGVVVAFSRAGWLNYVIAIGAVVVAFLARRGGRRGKRRVLACLAATAVVGVVVLVASGSLSFLEQRSGKKAYDQQRFASQALAYDSIDHTALGHGPGQADVGLPISPHSIYARTTYEQGAVGLTLLVLVLGTTALAAYRLARRDLDLHGVGGAALLGSWLGIVVNGAFVDTLHWRHLWVVAAMIWTATALTPREATWRRPWGART